MAYVVDGNLYLQDGGKSPLRLTHSGQDASPIFSDDGEKIIFYRGKLNDNNNVYSVNHDGSQEKALITNNWLSALGTGTKVGPLVFVPGTHQLLFNTYLCPEDLSLGCTTGLFLGDVETGEISQILAPSLDGQLPFSGDLAWRGNFSVSPDGKLFSVASAGHIDILDMEGNLVYRSILTYTRSTPLELFPRIYWLPDLTGLIIALPAESNYGGGYETKPAYTVWRYEFESGTAMQIPLDVSPMGVYLECSDIIHISPDSNRILYSGLTTDNYQLYIGDLKDGHTQAYALVADCSPAYWSSDNTHFIYGWFNGTYLGTVGGSLVSIEGGFLGWIDATHFIYSELPNERNIFIAEITDEKITTSETGISLQDGYYRYSFTFVILGRK